MWRDLHVYDGEAGHAHHVGVEVGGTVGTVHWFIDFGDMAELEAGLGKTLTDAGYLEILAKADGLFIEGRSHDTLIYTM